MKKSIDRLEYLCATIPALLNRIEDQEFSEKINPKKWSKKEIIGHLIDSAANNHHRFVKGQFEQPSIGISYDQDLWNEYGYYQAIDGKQIISFWTSYNKQLLELIKRIPQDKLGNTIKMGENELTIEFLIQDYIEHMEHHLKQVVSY